jgi:ATP-dependent RNA helicase DOB1
MEEDDLFAVFSEPISTKSREFDHSPSPVAHKKLKTLADVLPPSNPAVLPISHQSIAFAEYQEQEFKVLSDEGCIHEVCFPPLFNTPEESSSLEKEKEKVPARTYPFELDAFQKRSVECLENGQSVLVSAHTSAGKTVVAEYAISMALRDGQRVIYTSPIKALSNQKYREFQEEFVDVGLMTGDVVINPSASCLVMTTEILRNMLYRGAEIMREVAWVIFDEVHYMSDRSRGVCWEECMILLPHKVKYVFLSATIPNAREFCLWIAKLHNFPCNVVYTEKRPTPLVHYAFPVGGSGLHMIVDKDGQFKDANFSKALADLNSQEVVASTGGKSGKSGIGAKSGKDKRINSQVARSRKSGEICKLVKMLYERKFDPIIVFSFSKRECEAHAVEVGRLEFTNETEKASIGEIFKNAIDGLSDDDKKLPQVSDLLPLLQQGIGIHHSGLLPILKEVTEILFQEGFLKVLFSTETFSMGLNMPARTVVFTSISKFDGVESRLVSPGEYIQMSGRAGRRGLDDRGTVIMVMDEHIEPPVAKQMMKGKPDPLNSSFHVGYNMLLNLLRVEDANPEYVVERSFYQFQSTRSAPEVKEKIEVLKEEYKQVVEKIKNFEEIKEYYKIRLQLELCVKQMKEIRNLPLNILSFLNQGRLLKIKDEQGLDWGWGVLMDYSKKRAPMIAGTPRSIDGSDDIYVLEVLLKCKNPDSNSISPGEPAKPIPVAEDDPKFDLQMFPVTLACVDEISAVKTTIPKSGRLQKEDILRLADALRSLKREFKSGIPLLDPFQDMTITDSKFKSIVRQIADLESELIHHPLAKNQEIQKQFETYEESLKISKQIETAEFELKMLSHNLVIRHNLKYMKRVLKKLGLVNSENIVTLKGRVACELTTCDELVGTELLFNGKFNDLSPEQIVSMLSCLVFSEASSTKVKNPPEPVLPCLQTIREMAKYVANIVQESKLTIDVDVFVDSFRAELMDVSYEWSKGMKFVDVVKLTDVYEGSIIRCIRRIEELIGEMINACKIMGNDKLAEVFGECRGKVKRDIVFAGSLYL